MSCILKISKHQLDLARVELTGPSLLIGRSPLCDQVLRAPGIKPVHFLLEWVGEGEFNPNKGLWTLFDMGHLITGMNNNEWKNKNVAVEGIIIDNNQQHLGLNWSIVQDRMNATHFEKGIISQQIIESVKEQNSEYTKKLALEVVCLSQSEQKVQNIWYFFNKKIKFQKSSLSIPFNLKWITGNQLKIKFQVRPSAIFDLKGQSINIDQASTLSQQDTLILHFPEEIFFLRFVNRVEYQPIAFQFFKNKWLIGNLASFLFFCFILFLIQLSPIPVAELDRIPEARVVTIVEQEIPPEEKKITINLPEKIVNLNDIALKSENTSPSVVKNSVAATTKDKSDEEKATLGLSAPAKISDINAVGLLGRIKSSGSSGPTKQISAETIAQTFVENTASGTDQKGILINTSAMGVIGKSNNKTSPRGQGASTGNNLIEAQTTLRGAGAFSATNSGPLARTGGLSDARTLGLGRGKVATKGAIKESSSPADEVIGGLTKAQVYSVISAHRRQIRTCFESALLVRNDLNGILRMKFFINVAGSVTDIKVIHSELDSNMLEGCVIQIIRQMNFPQSPNQLPTTVIYPFVFKRTS